MKIKLFSDLHLEFSKNEFDHIHLAHPDDAETTLLLAGDIALGTQSKLFIEEMCKHFKYVLMTCGNHEFYHHDIKKVVKEFYDWELEGAPKNFHFLYNDERILDGVRFIGGTMWTSFNNGDLMVMDAAHRGMNDYAKIYYGDSIIAPAQILDEHNKFMEFLVKKFDEPFGGSTVVMSHHSPGNILKRKHRLDNLLDYCYFAELEDYIGNADIAKIWVHGHIHRNWDYMINKTRVLCNPYGYWGYATNKDFDRGFIVEV